ncbi:MAG: Neutral/alkaline non-lysosomal ceramidase [Limisphaerales bacterium]|nr:MAG: Neutral/alkaline non-lysosomal ceramidase [Limisphaerales bacterium]KAG0508331.1 MAG: Neutral/alkaline non-lysosomal ceramidase [Limisphaerales bacterium]TXT49646.1 MAG: Neutral/alkaline non-lysosomal ceramidase [Limisphaerales bacterium]
MTQVETPQSRCRFALAWGDITPPADIYHRMWGAAKHERATGVHRPLRATVTVFEALDNATARAGDLQSPSEASENNGRRMQTAGTAPRQILLALDHCVLGALEHGRLVAHIALATGQARESILVVFSHTHGAGLMGLERASLPGGDLIPGYLRSVAERAATLVNEALAKLAPADITYGNGCCNLAAHRDFWDAERKLWACGFNPAGPADDTVLVARVTGNDGKLLASVVNYACHPTTLAWDNTLISPDYIGALREVVERETGAPCLFLQGASAELGPVEGFVGDAAVADRNGRQLAYAALSTLTAMPVPGTRFRYTGPVVSGATLGTWAHEPLTAEELADKQAWQVARWNEPLAYRPGQPTAAQVEAELQQFQADEEAARTAGDAAKAADCRAMAERKRRLLHRLSQLPAGDKFPLQVTLWRMGDAWWLGVQGEFYSVLQTELRRRFPGKAIVVATIAADWGASYFPPRELYGTGIYQETIAVVAPGSLEQVVEAVAQRIEESR